MAALGAFDQLASQLGIEVRVARAVFKVESGGRGSVNGRLIVRFEPHIFLRESATVKLGRAPRKGESTMHGTVVLLPGMKVATSAEGFSRFSDKKRSFVQQQDEEYKAIATASGAVTEECALRSTSFGAPQIMGFNCKPAGYLTARAMRDAFAEAGATGDEEQKVAFLRFIWADKRLLKATVAKDFKTFASIYNGDTTDRYATLIRKAYEASAPRTA